MTPEERAILENTYELAKENNSLLRSLNRRARLGTAVKVFYWIIIIGLSFGAFYFIEPYLNFLKGVENKITSNSDLTAVQQIQDLLK